MVRPQVFQLRRSREEEGERAAGPPAAAAVHRCVPVANSAAGIASRPAARQRPLAQRLGPRARRVRGARQGAEPRRQPQPLAVQPQRHPLQVGASSAPDRALTALGRSAEEREQ